MTSGELGRRFLVALAILVVTLSVSVIWQKMVYTIPVLAALLYFAAGFRADGAATKRNLEEEASSFEAGTD